MAFFSTPNSKAFVIPSEARDLHFASGLQTPRSSTPVSKRSLLGTPVARDDNPKGVGARFLTNGSFARLDRK